MHPSSTTAVRPGALPRLAALALAASLGACGGGGSGDAPPPSSGTEPNNPLFAYQWHLRNTGQAGAPGGTVRALAGVDINVWPVWQQALTGRDVTVGIVDDGLDMTHENLAPNTLPALSYDFIDDRPDPTPRSASDNHGTSVAGVVAAAWNGVGASGVAPRARLAGLRAIGEDSTDSAILQALSHGIDANAIHVSNNSWGPYEGTVAMASAGIVQQATRAGVDRGRDGKGIVYLFAGGNERHGGGYNTGHAEPGYGWANFDHSREPQILTVCAANSEGTSSAYSDLGSNLLVCAPSSGDRSQLGITAATVFGNKYTHTFGGTSSASPTVAGIVALLLEANPALTWRDVRLILARTARILPSMEQDPDAAWITTQGHNPYTQQPYRYSIRYGFGLADATAAVAYARGFASVGGSDDSFWQNGCSVRLAPAAAIPKTTPQAHALALACGQRPARVEMLSIDIGLRHARFRDLDLELVSPSGTVIPLSAPYPYCGSETPNGDYCPTSLFGDRYRTSATLPLDEPASGTWTLRVSDHGTRAPGTLDDITLTVY